MLRSIEKQRESTRLFLGKHDGSRLKDLVMGIETVRKVETWDEALAMKILNRFQDKINQSKYS